MQTLHVQPDEHLLSDFTPATIAYCSYCEVLPPFSKCLSGMEWQKNVFTMDSTEDFLRISDSLVIQFWFKIIFPFLGAWSLFFFWVTFEACSIKDAIQFDASVAGLEHPLSFRKCFPAPRDSIHKSILSYIQIAIYFPDTMPETMFSFLFAFLSPYFVNARLSESHLRYNRFCPFLLSQARACNNVEELIPHLRGFAFRFTFAVFSNPNNLTDYWFTTAKSSHQNVGARR